MDMYLKLFLLPIKKILEKIRELREGRRLFFFLESAFWPIYFFQACRPRQGGLQFMRTVLGSAIRNAVDDAKFVQV